MKSQIENTEHGYIVSVWYDYNRNGNFHWHRLRNFGDRQGDAIVFRDYDVPKLDDNIIRLLIKNFDVTRKVKRIDNRHFKIQ